jgi:hypothetical protein
VTRLFVAGLDKGLFRLRPSDSFAQAYVDPPTVEIVSASDSLRLRLEGHRIAERFRARYTAARAIAFPTVLTEVRGLSVHGDAIRVRGKMLLSGAPGHRMVKHLRWKSDALGQPEAGGDVVDQALGEAGSRSDIERQMAAAAARRPGLPPLTDRPEAEWRLLPFVVPAKNLFNFYHFVSECALHLTLAAEYDLGGEIWITTRAPGKRAPFIDRLLGDAFPELRDRIRFVHGRIELEAALFPFNTRLHYHLAGPELMPDLAPVVPAAVAPWPDRWGDRSGDQRNLQIIYNNSFDACLSGLRRRLEARARPIAGAGRRLYVGRRPGPDTRRRRLVNEDRLLDMLRGQGFEAVHFEDHAPAEQASLCRGAEAVVTPHGAGLTNMLHAAPGALFVELSHRQALGATFADFGMHAHASGARYVSFLVDHDVPDHDADAIPDFDGHGLVGQRISDAAIERLRGLLAAHVHPERVARLKAEGAALNVARRFEDLGALLLDNEDLLHADADFLVWLANCQRNGDEPEAALRSLEAALRLAPRRPKLWERIEALSQAVGDRGSLERVARHRAFFQPLGEGREVSQARAEGPGPQDE